MSIETVATDVGLVAAIVAAIGVIWRQAVRPVISAARRIERALEAVDKELRPNGGSSLRDAVNRIDNRTAALEAWRLSTEKGQP